jgi:vitamin B12 transporter
VGYYEENYDQRYLSNDYFTSLPVKNDYFSELKALSLSNDHQLTLRDDLRLLSGLFYYQNEYESKYSKHQYGDRYGAHSTLEFDLCDDVTTTASARIEDYDTFGSKSTWRYGALWRVQPIGMQIRSGVGTSFRSPTYNEIYGSAFNPPNLELSPENAMGWDFGFDQKLTESDILKVSWFKNQIENQIYYPSFSGPASNLSGKTTTDGLEVGLNGLRCDDRLSYRFAWTYLHDYIVAAGLPKHSANGQVSYRFTDKLQGGLGVNYLSEHAWGLKPSVKSIDSYVTLRAFASYQLSDRCSVYGRVENLLNRQYTLYNGNGSLVNGAGAGVFTGVKMVW